MTRDNILHKYFQQIQSTKNQYNCDDMSYEELYDL